MGRAQEVLLSLVLGIFGWRNRRDVVIVVIQLLLDCLSHLLLVFIGCFHTRPSLEFNVDVLLFNSVWVSTLDDGESGHVS